jgi:hypothetical protein
MPKLCGSCGDSWLDASEEIKAAKEDAQRLANETGKAHAVYKEKYTGAFRVTDAETALAERYFVFETVSRRPVNAR